jgi:hypothetical protein
LSCRSAPEYPYIVADVKATLVAQGLEVAPGSPEQFAAKAGS